MSLWTSNAEIVIGNDFMHWYMLHWQWNQRAWEQNWNKKYCYFNDLLLFVWIDDLNIQYRFMLEKQFKYRLNIQFNSFFFSYICLSYFYFISCTFTILWPRRQYLLINICMMWYFSTVNIYKISFTFYL